MSTPLQLPPQGPKNPQFEAVKKFFKKHQERIILSLGVLLIAALSFGAGMLFKNQPSIKVNKNSGLEGEVKIPIKKEIQKSQEIKKIEEQKNKNNDKNKAGNENSENLNESLDFLESPESNEPTEKNLE